MAHPDSLAATLGLLPDSLEHIFGLTSIASLACMAVFSVIHFAAV